MVVVAERPATDLMDALEKAGAFPIVEATVADAPSAVAEVQPVGLVVAETRLPDNVPHLQALVRAIETRGGPYMPVFVRADGPSAVDIPFALPVAIAEPVDSLIARLRSALRVRSLHATVLRRSRAAQLPIAATVTLAGFLDHATVLCVGRARSYPLLTTAIAEQTGLIGAMSVETAGRYLKARDVDGIVIGEGFQPRVVEALLTVLGEDARFRDLPVGVLGRFPVSESRLCNLIRVESDASLLVERMLPFVRVQALESQLKRLLKSLEADGVLDPDTGLLGREAFWRDLDRAVQQAEVDGSALSVARFSFDDMTDARCAVDAARLFSRLVRDIDFACREQDGSILAAFTETDLRSAHVVARRIASVLRHTMLSPDLERQTIKPCVTLATLKPSDNLSTLVARVGTYPKVAAR
ncbi:MAG: GGDEF domain-containing protein [Xanthobacteraceae bacterium]